MVGTQRFVAHGVPFAKRGKDPREKNVPHHSSANERDKQCGEYRVRHTTPNK